MALYVTVKLTVADAELERLGLDPQAPETARKIADGVLVRVYPVAGSEPDEFLARDASVRVQRERVTVYSDGPATYDGD